MVQMSLHTHKDLNSRLGKNNFLRHFLKNALVAAFNFTTIEECQRWFKHIFIILLSPYKSTAFESSYEILRQFSSESDDDSDSSSKENVLSGDDKIDYLESIAMNSPFRKMFLEIHNEIKHTLKTVTIGRTLNPYRNENICIFLVNKYCAFIVLWTNVMGIHVDPSGEHISNAPVEFAFFMQKKKIIMFSSLKEWRYRYKMFGSTNDEIEDLIQLSLNDLNKANESSRINKEHSYLSSTPIDKKEICFIDSSVEIIEKEHSYSLTDTTAKTEPEETWGKVDIIKRKLIKPTKMHASQIEKKIAKVRENIENNTFGKKVDFFLFKFDILFSEVNNVNSIYIGFYDYIETSDWNSLNDDQWLTNFVLDSCLLAIIKESRTTDCYSMPVQVDNIQFDKMQMFTNNQPDMLFVPILCSNHFTLCVLKFLTHEFIYLNSFVSQNVGKRIYNNFLTTLGKNATLWKYKEISNRDLQKDAVSCGIFVLMYSAKILKNEPLINLGNPNDFRKEMKRLLLKHQGDKTRFCCQYGCLKKTKFDVYICENCKYYICTNCIYKHRNSDSMICKIIRQNILKI
ncbi:hypothetical protein CVS40_6870 [Lucilia cuprina]|nr:hypothetical protein CVS40_6870 [Lucilia cuprina]